MTAPTATLDASSRASTRDDVPGPAHRRTIGTDRLRGRSTNAAFAAAALAAIGYAAGALQIGRIADDARWTTVIVLALCVVGAAVFDTVGRVIWSSVVDRAAGELRADLLATVMQQPVEALADQAVGEILDRIDDDTHELSTLLRMSVWRVVRLAFVSLPLLVVAGITWWPAWLLFPATAVVVFVAVRPEFDDLARCKIADEVAWTDHAAALEESIAARDDLRTSLGQPYAVRRCAELAARIHERMAATVDIEGRILRRAGLILHGLLALVAVLGVTFTIGDAGSVAGLVTLYAVTVTFVGQIDQVAHQLPDLQAGVSALVRLRALIASPAEPTGGETLAPGPLRIEFRALHFAYDHGEFELDDVSLDIAPGTTCAFVGRSGSGKSTLAALLSRAIAPERGTVFVNGIDVLDIDLHELRSAIGVVTQRTEIIAGTLAENIAMFCDIDRSKIEQAVVELGLIDWVAGLPDGLDTLLGPTGATLSAGEEQLVAFARLLVRDVGAIVLDEATARMDPETEVQVVVAAQRLLTGRTGIMIAHRLGTTERADDIAVFASGRLVQHGQRATLASIDGPFRTLLRDADHEQQPTNFAARARTDVGGVRRRDTPPPAIDIDDPPPLRSGIARAIFTHPEFGLLAVALFLVTVLLGAYGAVSAHLWGATVTRLASGDTTTLPLAALVVCLTIAPFALATAVRLFPQWWIAVLLRVRTSVLVAQTDQRRLPPTPPGEVVARAMDADRFTRYADRWIDFVIGLIVAAITAALGGTLLAGAVMLGVMLVTAVTSIMGSPMAGRTAAASSTARADFGRALVSTLDAIRTVKLSAATGSLHAHLHRIDAQRVGAAVREHRVQSTLDGVPVVLVQSAVVAAWALHVADVWSLATALLVSGAVSGFDWFGRVAGAVITEAPGTRAWHRETSRLAAGAELMDLPDGIDLVTGAVPTVESAERDPFESLTLNGMSVVHDDGTGGVSDVHIEVRRGELVVLLGRIGSGKSSLLAALAGLHRFDGELRWNGEVVDDAETFLRPPRVAYVAQVPRVLSGTFVDNVRLDHQRHIDEPIRHAGLAIDIDDAGGHSALVGHRGVRLSGGQVQRLALARALATDAEVLVADDVSSALDATTEVELWETLRRSGRTVIGATNKRAALSRADRVIVLVDGSVAADGDWSALRDDWGHLAG